MKIYKPNEIGIELVNTNWPLPEGEVGVLEHQVPEGFNANRLDYYKFVDGVIVEKSIEEKDIIDLAIEMSPVLEEEAWQNNKSNTLKIMENVYVSFLGSQWTSTLRDKGIIAFLSTKSILAP